jgi:hypothetical protein
MYLNMIYNNGKIIEKIIEKINFKFQDFFIKTKKLYFKTLIFF